MGRIRYSTKLLGQVFGLARERRSYWLVPLVILLGFAAVVIIGSGAATPLIYTIF